MYRWEKLLRIFLETEDSSALCEEKNRQALRRMEAGGLVKVVYGDDVPLLVFPTLEGKVYFDKQREYRLRRWLDRGGGFLAGLITGSVTVWLPWIIGILSKGS